MFKNTIEAKRIVPMLRSEWVVLVVREDPTRLGHPNDTGCTGGRARPYPPIFAVRNVPVVLQNLSAVKSVVEYLNPSITVCACRGTWCARRRFNLVQQPLNIERTTVNGPNLSLALALSWIAWQKENIRPFESGMVEHLCQPEHGRNVKRDRLHHGHLKGSREGQHQSIPRTQCPPVRDRRFMAPRGRHACGPRR